METHHNMTGGQDASGTAPTDCAQRSVRWDAAQAVPKGARSPAKPKQYFIDSVPPTPSKYHGVCACAHGYSALENACDVEKQPAVLGKRIITTAVCATRNVFVYNLVSTSHVFTIFIQSRVTISIGQPCGNTKRRECFFAMHSAEMPSTPYRLRVPASHPRLAQPATALSCGAHGTMPKHMVFIRFIPVPQGPG
jgi:hypothetical protein